MFFCYTSILPLVKKRNIGQKLDNQYPKKGKYEVVLKLTVCSCHVTYAFESESTLYSCLNVKELLARSRREI